MKASDIQLAKEMLRAIHRTSGRRLEPVSVVEKTNTQPSGVNQRNKNIGV